MINIRQALRLYTHKVGIRYINEQTGIAYLALKRYFKEFDESGLTFDELNELNDADIEDLFSKPKEKPEDEKTQLLFNLFPEMNKQLQKKGVTKKLLWEEYKAKYPDGFAHSQFNSYFAAWKAQSCISMHKEHKAGDKMFVDFAGEKLAITDKLTGISKPVEVFVSILGASQLTYVEATLTQQKEDFIQACENALHYYGGTPAAIVCDNLKSAVTQSSRFEPSINQAFADFAEHYGMAVLPARSYKPKDKAPVENAIKIIYTRIYAKLRNSIFYSLTELNAAIRAALKEHNDTPLTGKEHSRTQLFDITEKQTLSSLSVIRYEFKKQQLATVTKLGHVPLSADKHNYSVPYQFIGRKVKLVYSREQVAIFYNYERIALHKRSYEKYKYTTDANHLHPSHRFVKNWGAEGFLYQAEQIHQDVKQYISTVLNAKGHPEQSYKMCIGILGFAKKVGNERFIKACQRATYFGIYNYRIIKKILEEGLDKEENEVEQLKMPEHENIRGSNYYK